MFRQLVATVPSTDWGQLNLPLYRVTFTVQQNGKGNIGHAWRLTIKGRIVRWPQRPQQRSRAQLSGVIKNLCPEKKRKYKMADKSTLIIMPVAEALLQNGVVVVQGNLANLSPSESLKGWNILTMYLTIG